MLQNRHGRKDFLLPLVIPHLPDNAADLMTDAGTEPIHISQVIDIPDHGLLRRSVAVNARRGQASRDTANTAVSSYASVIGTGQNLRTALHGSGDSAHIKIALYRGMVYAVGHLPVDSINQTGNSARMVLGKADGR